MKIQVQFIESQSMIQNREKTRQKHKVIQSTETRKRKQDFSNQRHKPHNIYTGGNEPKLHTAKGNGTIISARGDGNWSTTIV